MPLPQWGRTPKLYHLASDLAEKEDLSAREPGKLKELETAYAKWNARNIPAAWHGKEGRGAIMRAEAGPTGAALVAFRPEDAP
jgi:hypothetical protein